MGDLHKGVAESARSTDGGAMKYLALFVAALLIAGCDKKIKEAAFGREGKIVHELTRMNTNKEEMQSGFSLFVSIRANSWTIS